MLKMAAKWLPEAHELDDAISLNVYAVMMRYPSVVDDVTAKEALAAIKTARRVRDAVRESLNRAGLDLES